MNKHLRSFHLCLSFLSRIAPAPVREDTELSAILPWFLPCGLVLGTVLSLPVWIFPADTPATVLGWIVVMLEIYITRGLHWDGWADLWDGWGSNARGENFWQVLKDSRTGVFGVLAIVLGISGEILLLSAIGPTAAAVIWAMLLGRLAPVIQAYAGRKLKRPGLGQSFLAGADRKTLLLSLAAALVGGIVLVHPRAVFLSAVILAPFLYKLHREARIQNGLNGDFLGAGIIAGQLSALLGTVL